MKIVSTLAAALVLAAFAAAQAAPGGKAAAGPVAAAAPSISARPIMGVTMSEVDEALAEQIGVDADAAVVIESVMPGYGAAKAGIKKHDVITKLDGKSPVTTEGVRKALGKKKVGDKVTVTVVRGRETKEFEVELMAAKDDSGPAMVNENEPSVAKAGEPKGGVGAGVGDARGGMGRAASPSKSSGAAENRSDEARSALGGALQRRQSDEQLRSSIARLREQLRSAESEIAKRAHEVARDSAKMAEEFAKQARAKYEGANAEDHMRKLVELSREHSERTREKIETELRETMDRQRDQLERSMSSLESALAKLRYTEPLWNTNSGGGLAAPSYTTPTPFPGFTGPSQPKLPGVANPPGASAGGGQNPIPYAVLGDGSAKALKKVEDRLGGIEERLQHIEELVEKLLARSTTKNPK